MPAHKIVMGIPAYSNDYSALPGHGCGNGSQAGVGPPASTEKMCGGNGTHAAAGGKGCCDVGTFGSLPVCRLLPSSLLFILL